MLFRSRLLALTTGSLLSSWAFLRIIRSACAASRSASKPAFRFNDYFSRKDNGLLRYEGLLLLCFLSASAFASASFIMQSISSSVKPEFDWITLFCSEFKVFSLNRYDTVLVDIECYFDLGYLEECSWDICQLETPRVLLSTAVGVYEERGYQRLVGCLLQLKTCDLDVGIVVLRSMSFVKTPPIVSIPSDNVV